MPVSLCFIANRMKAVLNPFSTPVSTKTIGAKCPGEKVEEATIDSKLAHVSELDTRKFGNIFNGTVNVN